MRDNEVQFTSALRFFLLFGSLERITAHSGLSLTYEHGVVAYLRNALPLRP